MKKLLILLSLVLATNAWAEYFYVDCELATHKRKGTPLTQFKDVCSEDLKSECYYSEIQLIIDFQTYHPRRNYWSLKGYEDVQVMVRGKKEVTSLTDWSGTSWDSWGEYELPEEKYEFN